MTTVLLQNASQSNILLAWNNRTDSGTLSGGSWSASLPLANLQNRQVQKVARSSNAATSSTQFRIDLGQSRTIGVLALVVHNISVTGKARIVGSDAASAFTNLLTFPSEFDNAAWTKATTTVTANATAAPDGTATADLLTATGANSGVYQAVTIGATTAYMASVWLRASAPTTIEIVTIQTPSSTVTSTTCNVTTSWQKFSISGTTQSGTTAMTFYVGGNSTFTTGEAVFAWGADVVTGSGAIYDSGWNEVWPTGMVPQNLLEWEDDNFWLGTLSQNARAGFQSPYIHILPTQQNLRHWRVEISDTTNADGYIQIGRLFMSSTWVPSVNYSYGASLGYQDPSPVDVSLSGAEFFDTRSKFRVFDFDLEYIQGTEAYGFALELQRIAGTSGEVMVVPDPEDFSNMPIRAFVGRMSQLGPVKQPQPQAYSCSLSIKELI